MPADASIYNAFSARPKNALEYQADYAAADDAKVGREVNMLKVQGARQEAQDAAGLRNYLSGGADLSTPEGQAGLYRAAPTKAGGILKSQAEIAKERALTGKAVADTGKATVDTESAQFKLSQDRRMRHLQELTGVNDVQAAGQWLDQAAASGELPLDKVAQVKQQLIQNPQSLQQWKQGAIAGGFTLQQQRENEWKAKEFGLRQETQAETGRHNRSAEGLTARGQNMTDSRARDAISATMTKPFEVTTPDGGKVLVQQDKAGNIRPVEGYGPKAANERPLTEGQGKAVTFAARMQDANSIIENMEKSGVSGSDVKTIAAGSPYSNWAASPAGQQYRQAQENWVTANLRQESGAAIGKDEMDKDVRKFFPTPGDSAPVKAQKAVARKVAMEGMATQAGPGAKNIPGILSRSGSTAAPGVAAGSHPADISSLLDKYGK